MIKCFPIQTKANSLTFDFEFDCQPFIPDAMKKNHMKLQAIHVHIIGMAIQIAQKCCRYIYLLQ